MRIILPSGPSAILGSAAGILARELDRKTGIKPEIVEDAVPQPNDIVLCIAPHLAAESFDIAVSDDSVATVSGGDSAGVLYGCGSLLHRADFSSGLPAFKPTDGVESPECPIRGIYFATHCYNWYHNAPIEEIRPYIEELALWGVNACNVWFDMNYYSSLDGPQARKDLGRMREIQSIARSVGMKISILVIANESYNTSPVDLRADFTNVVAPWGRELCPSKPEGRKLLLEQFAREFEQFDHLDFLWIWPYDSGGCSCDRCSPWGANGFLSIGKDISDLFRRRNPDGKIMLSTWSFDLPENGITGEWDGLLDQMQEGLEWIDYLIVDGHHDFPKPPLERGIPRGVPMVAFPEISMLGMSPWGSYGTNPLPKHWQDIWDTIGGQIAGGFPYSEGFFEDVNKVVWVQLYWDGSRTVTDIMREYAAYEFSPDHADDIVHAMELMEKIHNRWYDTAGRPDEVHLETDMSEADEIWEIVSQIDTRLSQPIREGWRWRMIFLRAQIDEELKSSGGKPTPALNEAFCEIYRRYYADERSWMNLRPIKFSACPQSP